MRCDDVQFAAGLCDAMQLIYETENVGNMLDNMTANYFFEFIIVERIRKDSEIVNHICMTQTIRVDADRAGKFILTTTDVENLSAFGHQSVFVQQQLCQFFKVESVNRLT
jgi:hypothetical protein